MLDPSLLLYCAGASAFGGLVALPSRCDEALVGERMDHPAATVPACQTSVRSACPYTKLLTISVSPGLSSLHRRSAVHTGHMKDAAELAEPPPLPPPLPPAMAAALAAFERYLRSERSLSPHTVRAYAGDVSSMLEHASRQGVDAPEGLGVAELRGWLAIQHESGAARATLARRGAAARSFTAFAYRRGWLATDPGSRLGTLKTRRALPHILRQDEIAAVLAGLDKARRQAEAATAADAAQAAVALRDAAVLELFYATGIRVSELCGLDPVHLDHGRRTVRVRGKGDKERTVPVGVPALAAVDRWLATGRPALATAASGSA